MKNTVFSYNGKPVYTLSIPELKQAESDTIESIIINHDLLKNELNAFVSKEISLSEYIQNREKIENNNRHKKTLLEEIKTQIQLSYQTTEFV